MMERTSYDAVVVGGGPAGSAAATLVAKAGYTVLQLEKETFPRFKVGESLIPASNETLARLGMLGSLRDSAFVKKYSVQFISGSGRASAPFYFSETEPEKRAQTWQVLRSKLDHMLLENGRRHGVEAHDGVAVTAVRFDGERATGVRARLADGRSLDIAARVVVDASGQRALIGRKLKLRQPDPCLRMAALFTHFEGGQRDSGIDEGATLIINTESRDAWFWYIPLPDDRVSVGVVGPLAHLVQGRQGDPQQVFDEEIARCPGLQPRLATARQTMAIKVLNDFSYRASRAAGDGWVLVGDAYAFLDPVYSTGVLLALKSGELAADAIVDALGADDPSADRLNVFEPVLRDALGAFRQLVYAFYNKDFNFARFLNRFPAHRAAIVSILVGDVFGRDFSALYGDMDRFLDLPAQTVAATAEVAP